MTNGNNVIYRIADLSDDDKPREKAISLGIDSLSTTELVAIVLGSGLPGKSVIDLSREILASCDGDLEKLARMSIKELSRKFKGVGPAKAVSLAAAIALGRRCLAAQPLERPRIGGSDDAFRIFKPLMLHLDHEEFKMAILNRANRVMSVETISTGGTAATVVDIKILLKMAIDSLAEGVIVAHNHPSGQLQPSAQDDTLTRRIKAGLDAVGVKLLDHVIVTSGGYYSYNDHGRL